MSEAESGAAGGRVSAVGRPRAVDLPVLGVAVVAISTAGPLIAAAAAPMLAVAFWRNAMSCVYVLPAAALRHRRELAGLSRREWGRIVLAGLLLAAHFGTWIPALGYTSVAAATALTSTQPVWNALLARLQGRLVPLRAWVGIAIALVAVVLLAGVEVSLSPQALTGDLLALAGGVFGAGYVAVGATVRTTASTTAYTAVCYPVAALCLLVVCLATGQSLAGYPPSTWLLIAGVALGAQLLGHSLFNYVLRSTPATVVSLAMLLEVPGAALLAAVLLGQTPSWAVFAAIALMLAGTAVVVAERTRGSG